MSAGNYGGWPIRDRNIPGSGAARRQATESTLAQIRHGAQRRAGRMLVGESAGLTAKAGNACVEQSNGSGEAGNEHLAIEHGMRWGLHCDADLLWEN